MRGVHPDPRPTRDRCRRGSQLRRHAERAVACHLGLASHCAGQLPAVEAPEPKGLGAHNRRPPVGLLHGSSGHVRSTLFGKTEDFRASAPEVLLPPVPPVVRAPRVSCWALSKKTPTPWHCSPACAGPGAWHSRPAQTVGLAGQLAAPAAGSRRREALLGPRKRTSTSAPASALLLLSVRKPNRTSSLSFLPGGRLSSTTSLPHLHPPPRTQVRPKFPQELLHGSSGHVRSTLLEKTEDFRASAPEVRQPPVPPAARAPGVSCWAF